MDRDYSNEAEKRFTEVFGSVRDARAAITSLGLEADLAERAALVVTELATNAILHAGGLLYVRLWHYAGHMRVEVADASGVMPAAVPATAMGGRGLRIVEAMAESWGADPRPGGKVVWAELE